jgi:hypothetical protein
VAAVRERMGGVRAGGGDGSASSVGGGWAGSADAFSSLSAMLACALLEAGISVSQCSPPNLAVV